MASPAISKTQINKAADRLVEWWCDPSLPDLTMSADETLHRAVDIVLGFRQEFQRPLDKVTIQLRRFISYETNDVVAAQRLKRLPTILDKLERHPHMDLTRMQDIGGCRGHATLACRSRKCQLRGGLFL